MRFLMTHVIAAAVVGSSAHAALLFDNYGEVGQRGAEYFDSELIVAQTTQFELAEDFLAPDTSDIYIVDEVRWLAEANATVNYARAEITILIEQEGVFVPHDVIETTATSPEWPGPNPAAFRGELSAALPTPFQLQPGVHYAFGVKLVGDFGDHKIASAGGVTGSHNQQAAMYSVTFGSQTYPWESLGNISDHSTEIAMQLHGVIIPEPAVVVLMTGVALLVAYRRR